VVYRNKDRDGAMKSEEERRDSSFGGYFQVLFGDGGIRL